MSWPYIRLDSICRIVQGGRHKLSGKHFVEVGGFPAYGAGGLNGYLPSYEFDEPAIVLSAIGARCGKCFQPSGKWSSLANTSVFFPDKTKADVRFLWYQLNDEDSWHRSGTAQPYIKPSDIKGRLVFLPPLADQQRIAGILDAADALRATRREALAQLDTLLQSTFLDMFGDPVTNPMGWEVVELASLVESNDRINYGVVQPGDEFPGGKPLIRVGDFISGELHTTNLKRIAPDIEQKYKRSRLTGREILVSCVTAGVIGTVCKAPSEVKGFNIARAVARVPLRDDVDRDFMLYCLRSEAIRRYFMKETRTVAQPTLNIGLIKSAPVFLPPAELQHRFATIVESVEQQKARMRGHLAELDALFACLQSRAFNGELRAP